MSQRGKFYWRISLLCFVLLIKGGQLQQRGDLQSQKPKVVWAAPVDKVQQWNGLNYNDRQWMFPDPTPAVVYNPPPTPAPTTSAPAPPPPSYPAQPPPAPSYPEPAPAPAYQPEPYQPPAPSPYYPPAPSYEPPQGPPAQNGYYYYYYPVQKPDEKPSWKELFKKEKEALDVLMPGKNLSEAQKIWIAVLAPLIVVSLVVPLAAILFSNFTFTTAKRSDRQSNVDGITHQFSDIAARAGALLESDECIQRVICTLGSYTSSVPGKSYLLSILDNMVPDTMQNNMRIFKKAADGGDEDCKRFTCSSWKF